MTINQAGWTALAWVLAVILSGGVKIRWMRRMKKPHGLFCSETKMNKNCPLALEALVHLLTAGRAAADCKVWRLRYGVMV